MAKTIPLFINNQFIESKSSQTQDVVDPSTQEVLAKVPFATNEEVNQAVDATKAAFKTWSEVAVSERARIFLKYQDLLKKTSKRIGRNSI
jgi:malonate-semialdehyde dehydrogenase (acetylating)/methylmalonate-semialdehyde dehydrogenase